MILIIQKYHFTLHKLQNVNTISIRISFNNWNWKF